MLLTPYLPRLKMDSPPEFVFAWPTLLPGAENDDVTGFRFEPLTPSAEKAQQALFEERRERIISFFRKVRQSSLAARNSNWSADPPPSSFKERLQANRRHRFLLHRERPEAPVAQGHRRARRARQAGRGERSRGGGGDGGGAE